jgi:hypothetical protein
VQAAAAAAAGTSGVVSACQHTLKINIDTVQLLHGDLDATAHTSWLAQGLAGGGASALVPLCCHALPPPPLQLTIPSLPPLCPLPALLPSHVGDATRPSPVPAPIPNPHLCPQQLPQQAAPPPPPS